jgi:Holliday junction DNA helicase RuvA
LDLKEKWKGFGGLFAPGTPQPEAQNGALEEALLALTALGYSEREIKKITPKLKDQSLTAEAYVKEALRLMLND